MLIIIIESFLGKYARSARASRQEGVVLVDYAGSHFRPTSQSSHMHKWSGAGGFHSHVSRHFTAPFSSPICPINSPSLPHAHRRIPPQHRASSNGDMVLTTHSRCYAAASASPPACAIVIARPEVEHHSAHQRRDRNGRFVAAAGTSNARPRRRITTRNRRRMVPVVPNVQVSIDLGFQPSTVAINLGFITGTMDMRDIISNLD